MKVLVIGNGGREHALCWHLARHSPDVEIFCAPGSDGIASCAEPAPIAVDEVQRLADFAEEAEISLTIVGPELPLALGIVDEFKMRGLDIFGPNRMAAQLESSKVYAKEFLRRHAIPTARFEIAHDAESARDAVAAFGFPVALKADGLAAGKGVLLVHDGSQLDEALEQFFGRRRFGTAGDRVVVEEFLTGEEVSFIGLSDGKRLLPFATSKDYKRIGEDDTGPNTGGMGAHSPSGVADAPTSKIVLEQVLLRTIEAMADEGTPYVGFLYAGIMLTDDGPKVLEFNVRLGDPEAQALLLRLEDDLARLLHSGVRGGFETRKLKFRQAASACLVLAAEGYPERPVKGPLIEGLDASGGVSEPRGDEVEVFHAGTSKTSEGWAVTGGRTLNVCATGADLRAALRHAYQAAVGIGWPGRQLRRDIGRRVVTSSRVELSGIFKIPDLSA